MQLLERFGDVRKVISVNTNEWLVSFYQINLEPDIHQYPGPRRFAVVQLMTERKGGAYFPSCDVIWLTTLLHIFFLSLFGHLSTFSLCCINVIVLNFRGIKRSF